MSRSVMLESICEALPNCTKALALAERGVERPLSWREKLALKYHSPLCPYCGCNKFTFERAMERLKEAEEERRNKGGPA